MRTNTQIKFMYYPLKLCAISIIGQKKAFCQQRIREPSCGSLEHVEMVTENHAINLSEKQVDHPQEQRSRTVQCM